MATVVVRRPWATQPNALPKPSALANSLRVSTLLLPTSAGWADATGNLYRTGGSGTVVTVATPDGLARTSSISAAWSDFLLDRGTLNPSDGYAWVMRGTLNSVLGSWGGIIARTADNATGQGWAWQRAGSDVLTVYHNAAAYSNSGTLSQFVDSKPHTFVGVWRKSESKLELWVDGVLRWSQTGASTAPLYTAGQGQLKVMSSRDTPNINGKVAMVGVFNRSLSQGEAQALSLRPWQLFRARRRVLYFDVAAGGGITAAVGQVTETDTAQAIAVSPIRRLLGQIVETDTAQAVARIKILAISQTTETDAAQAVSSRKVRAVGQAGETDTAQAIAEAGAITAAVGQTTETDAAQAIAVSPLRRLLGQAAEADSAQAIAEAGAIVAAVGQAQESDAAQAISSSKTLAVGMVTETEFAQAIAHYKTLGVLQTVESDSAHSIVPAAIRALNPASESDGALAIALAGGAVASLSAPRTTYSNTQTATRSNTQTARRPRA